MHPKDLGFGTLFEQVRDAVIIADVNAEPRRSGFSETSKPRIRDGDVVDPRQNLV